MAEVTPRIARAWDEALALVQDLHLSRRFDAPWNSRVDRTILPDVISVLVGMVTGLAEQLTEDDDAAWDEWLRQQLAKVDR